jgi:PAS domain-containing protein
LTTEERLKIISKNSVEGILIINESGSIVEWNDYMVEKTRFPKKAILGRKIWDVQFGIMSAEWQVKYPVSKLREIWLNFIQNINENEFVVKEGQFLGWDKKTILTEDIICRINLKQKRYLYVVQRNRGIRNMHDHEDSLKIVVSDELKSLTTGLHQFSGLYDKKSRSLHLDKLVTIMRQLITSLEVTIKSLENYLSTRDKNQTYQ